MLGHGTDRLLRVHPSRVVFQVHHFFTSPCPRPFTRTRTSTSKMVNNSPRGMLLNKTEYVWFSLVEFVLSGCRGGVERVQGSRAFVRGPEAPEHVGKTISYSQMLSGHCSSYAWTPQGHTNTQLGKALGHSV